eukprot:TRINITY_DN2338_c0_g2_i5.p1 TRINITY_DN2338_c0_g2~~TRINITY_DN2338_c0_g2_i5.p1  ORF type:complete len:110 (+),score=13.85 TRINITY_DN2338_c0_g2_i5:330-659(+)
MPPMGRQTFGGRIKYRPLNLVKGVSTFVETLFTVEDDDGQVIFTKRDAKTGTFAFTAEQGIYQYCFINSLKGFVCFTTIRSKGTSVLAYFHLTALSSSFCFTNFFFFSL